MKILLFLITFHLLTIACFAQIEREKNDTAKLDDSTKELIDLFQNWKQENEPWTELKITLSDPEIEIFYFQQPAHPFLAEYNRKIIFKTPIGQTDTINMFMNTGGRTLFNLYCMTEKDKKVIILEDYFGFYLYDLKKNEYSEAIFSEKMQAVDDHNTVFLGKIDGESYPLRFIDKNNETKKKIQHDW
jgi:hypothetical protein